MPCYRGSGGVWKKANYSLLKEASSLFSLTNFLRTDVLIEILGKPISSLSTAEKHTRENDVQAFQAWIASASLQETNASEEVLGLPDVTTQPTIDIIEHCGDVDNSRAAFIDRPKLLTDAGSSKPVKYSSKISVSSLLNESSDDEERKSMVQRIDDWLEENPLQGNISSSTSKGTKGKDKAHGS